jgi:hypothetical protein
MPDARMTVLAALLFAGVPIHAFAQCNPEWDARFPFPGTGSPTNTLTAFDDGHGPALFVGGTFGMAGGIPADSVARWDGTNWSDLLGGADGFVDATLVFDDGSGAALFAGGAFTSIGGTSASRIARWNGSTWSALGVGVAGRVDSLAAFDDGSGPELYAAVTTLGTPPMSSVVRWDGASWSAVGSAFAGSIAALEAFDEGSGSRLFAGGLFSSAGGTAASNVARWDGASWTAVGSGTDDEVSALKVFDDGSGAALYVGGGFDVAGGVAASSIARWDGTSWSALGNGAASPSAIVVGMTVFDDGGGPALFVGGGFASLGGVAASAVAKWDGSSWSPLGSGISGSVIDMEAFSDGSGQALYLVGEFTRAGGVFTDRIARWDGANWSALGLGTNGQIDALCASDVGGAVALYAAGHFDSAGSASAAGIARWDGGAWSQVGGGFPFGGVQALLGFASGGTNALYAGGAFSSAGGVVAQGIARFDGATWSAVAGGVAGAGAEVQALAVFDDGLGPALFAGGSFTSAGGVAAASIARWNGTGWSALGGGITGGSARVEALAVFDDGSGSALYAAGSFTAAGGLPTGSIAKWDGATWSPIPGIPLGFTALAVFDNGAGSALYAGGIFTSVGGVAARSIARWDGAQWSPLGAGVEGSVESLVVFDEGVGPRLYVGGSFTQAGGVQSRRVARWDGAGWSALGSGIAALLPNGVTVRALAVFDDGTDGAPDLYAGGSFSSAGGFGSSGIALWHGCASAFTSGCFGDGTQATPCPCGNTGQPGRGCENSSATGGARLAATGTPSPDTVVLTATGERSTALSIFLQGDVEANPGLLFGDGVRCVSGHLKRLYFKNALGGVVTAPRTGDPSITARSAALGDPIAPGSTRWYQVYYRDPQLGFCPAPPGGAFNVSSALAVRW